MHFYKKLATFDLQLVERFFHSRLIGPRQALSVKGGTAIEVFDREIDFGETVVLLLEQVGREMAHGLLSSKMKTATQVAVQNALQDVHCGVMRFW